MAEHAWPSVADLAAHIGASANGLRPYMSALEKRGYIKRTDDQVVLVKNTGTRAPGWSTHTDEFRDWNVDPAMDAVQLRALVIATGLSHREWCRSAGFRVEQTTRLRQMMNGQRPVSDGIASAAIALAASLQSSQ